MFTWLRRALLALPCLLLVGSLYQLVTSSRDASRFHTPGRMIDVGNGRRMSLDCKGAGSPTVILESGLGSPAILWNPVLNGVEPLTRVCAYDRAGYGYSDAGPSPRTTNAIVDDLEKLLAAAGEKGPYVLVGHSFGGFNIRVFQARHKQDVVGLIFVDSSHPEQDHRMPPGVLQKQRLLNTAAHILPVLLRVGVVRAALAWGKTDEELTFLETQPKFAQAMLSELDAFPESGRQTAAASPILGDLPIIVLTAGKDGTGMPELYKKWREEFQPELVRLSSKSKQHIVEGATHLIPTEKPQAVIDAVREMLGDIKLP